MVLVLMTLFPLVFASDWFVAVAYIYSIWFLMFVFPLIALKLVLLFDSRD